MDTNLSNTEKFLRFVAQTSENPLNIEIVEANGSMLKDSEGKEYLDFISGIAVSNLGHRHPAIINALKEQLDQHLFVMVYGEFATKSQSELAEKLISILPDHIDNVYFGSTGTEAIEGALKLAKRYTGRHKIISLKKSYHGSTHGSLSVSGNEMKKYAFRPLLPEVYHIELNSVAELDLIDDQTACVLIEPIQGDAGVRIPDESWIKKLEARCKEKGALLIVDEIQVGMGRTGKWFAYEHYNINPDIVVMGKALGGGLPLGAFASSREIMESFTSNPALGHITTFGGNPMSCAASLAFIKAIENENILEDVEQKGQVLESYLMHPKIVEVRRKGLLFAVEFANPEQANQLVMKALKKGLLAYWFLSCPEAFRLSPPLNISDEDLRKGGEILKGCIREILD